MKMKSLTVGTIAGMLSLSAVPVLTSTSVMAAEEFHVDVTCTASGTKWNGASKTCKKDYPRTQKTPIKVVSKDT